ncbi:TadE/TadG family type IV pilus assembly protein [Oceanobacillus salinisoli]|uniref:TadE/TadG family type IV pilus assembly protein n=1 Tax=Oceanobacillus salinisoli TaxID=2678611 RepID=UPI0012E0D6B8|nr:TadE/TadG family type IV pilus assembly protein [Oceanobacillus salinisoli]
MIREEKGQALLEFALVVPLFLLLLVGIVDIGRLGFSYSSLHFTAQETVRLGGLGKTDEQLVQFARENFSTGDSSKLQVNITPEGTRKSGEYITVTLTYPIEPVTPFANFIFSNQINLNADSTIRME